MLIAALVPDLAPFISLIGAVFFSILGLMCPAVIHLATFWNHNDDEDGDEDDWDSGDESSFDGDYYAVADDAGLGGRGARRPPQMRRGSAARRRKGMSRAAVAKDVAIVLIALIALVSGTYASLVDIVAFYNGGGHGGGAHGGGGGGNATVFVTASPADAVIGPGPESVF